MDNHENVCCVLISNKHKLRNFMFKCSAICFQVHFSRPRAERERNSSKQVFWCKINSWDLLITRQLEINCMEFVMLKDTLGCVMNNWMQLNAVVDGFVVCFAFSPKFSDPSRWIYKFVPIQRQWRIEHFRWNEFRFDCHAFRLRNVAH